MPAKCPCFWTKAGGQFSNSVKRARLAKVLSRGATDLLETVAIGNCGVGSGKPNYQGLDLSGSFTDILSRMDRAQAEFLMAEINDRIAMK